MTFKKLAFTSLLISLCITPSARADVLKPYQRNFANLYIRNTEGVVNLTSPETQQHIDIVIDGLKICTFVLEKMRTTNLTEEQIWKIVEENVTEGRLIRRELCSKNR